MFRRDEEEPSDFGRPRLARKMASARGGGARRSAGPSYRLLLMGLLLALTIFAIRVLDRPEPEGFTLLIAPFDTVGSAAEQAVLDGLTDRVATRVSRIPRIRMVVLDRGQEEAGSATHRLAGMAVRVEDELRVEVRLVRMSPGTTPAVFQTRGPADRLGETADRIAEWIGANL